MATQTQAGFSPLTRNPAPRRAAYLSSLFFVVIGVVVLVSGIHRYNLAQPIAGGRTATGTVISVSTGQNCNRNGCSTYWVPTIQYPANGSDFTFAGPESNSLINTGDQVQVSYDPSNPAIARDVSAGEGEAWTEIVLGSLAILFGVVSFLLGFRRLHAMLNLSSARDEGGWVGHSGLHSIRGISAGGVVLVALIIFWIVLAIH